MDTIIRIFPEHHVTLSWALLKQTIVHWSEPATTSLWGPSIDLSAWRRGDPVASSEQPDERLPSVPPDFLLDPGHSYRIDLAAGDYGPWLNYQSLRGRSDPRNIIATFAPTFTPEALNDLADKVRHVGYYLTVLTRPREQLRVQRLRAVACAVAELFGGALGVDRDDFTGMETSLYRLDEFRQLDLPYRRPIVISDEE